MEKKATRKQVTRAPGATGLQMTRYFTREGVHPFAAVEWELRTAEIKDGKTGKVAFRQENVEFPKFWSQRATDIVSSKYFRGHLGSAKREHSVKQLVGRIANTLTKWGKQDNYFATSKDAEIFNHELTHLLVQQMAAFNSPVQFNVGIRPKPQCSACFINEVTDDMESIMKLAKTEAMIFKGGSGSGVNLSRIRSSAEPLAVGGIASGPVSFMRGWDSFAGAIKSGGATRRAAKMVILNADHPDIVEYIWCKAKEEKKAHQLIGLGYDGSIDGEAYKSVQFQNANNSVAATDEFMRAVIDDREWQTRKVTTGEPAETYKAREMMRMIAEATHICGDPGLQFYSTINDWHTCPNTAPIVACNPCSEYVFHDNSACNLSSLNLMKFVREDGLFDIESFRRAVQVMITAKEIIVSNSSYPTAEIEKVSHNFRTLGLGYANLGSLLMFKGLAYDSDQSRDYAAAITALMTGEAYLTSARIAEQVGPFAGFEENRIPMMAVMNKHREAISGINSAHVPFDLLRAAMQSWDQAIEAGEQAGYRNAQTTLLAPTGTIAFMMDCDTTGIEPDFALVKTKRLVGGGTLKIVNQMIPAALKRLGYTPEQTNDIVQYVDRNETIEGAPHLKEEDLSIFDCADRAVNGSRSIHYMGHIKMAAVVQPFLSGAISKTINLPNEASVDEIMNAYIAAWELGMKSVSVYRDGCKLVQPLSNKEPRKDSGAVTGPIHRNMPKDHPAWEHEFRIRSFKGFLTLGMYPEDNSLGEIFLNFAKQGSTLQGMAMAWAIAISMGLQRGVPLEDYVRMFAHMSFEPSGMTDNKQIPFATSIPDYVVRYLATKFLSPEAQQALGIHEVDPGDNGTLPASQFKVTALSNQKEQKILMGLHESSAPVCGVCGNMMQRNGSCYACPTCGVTSGCS